MPDTKLKYGTSNQTVTVTLASLASTSLRESTFVSNTTNLFIDVLVGGKITSGTSPSTNGQVNFYLYGTVDDGTTYTAGATGTDAAFTVDTAEKASLFRLGIITTDSTSSQTFEFGPWSVAAAFGGTVPARWGIIVENLTGTTLHATGSNHAVKYQGIHLQSV